eukprot:TRINITY_DN8167_c0_g1_i1.p1 TRINITY_DN8167_c0_g1~~TRINITY_DN8167_c0_g1_i1.p1  ORF type:complete len:193 (-),score=47.88 TRINITY_DN8167_c0_g1_i1:114-692(-)
MCIRDRSQMIGMLTQQFTESEEETRRIRDQAAQTNKVSMAAKAKNKIQGERISHLEAEFKKVKLWRTQQQQKLAHMKAGYGREIQLRDAEINRLRSRLGLPLMDLQPSSRAPTPGAPATSRASLENVFLQHRDALSATNTGPTPNPNTCPSSHPTQVESRPNPFRSLPTASLPSSPKSNSCLLYTSPSPRDS